MRSFIHMIRSLALWVWGAMKGLWSTTVCCGRAVCLSEDKGTDASIQEAVTPPPSAESTAAVQPGLHATSLASSNTWFEGVGFLSFNRAKRTGERRVTLHFPESAYPASFSDLVVNAYFSVHAANQPESVQFAIDPDGKVETTPQRRCYTLPLRVSLGASAEEAARIKETCEGVLLYPANVCRIELTLDGKKRQFFNSGSGHFFPRRLPRPAKNLAAGQNR